MQNLSKFIRQSPAHRALLFEALLWLGFARLQLITWEFKNLAPTLGRHMQNAETECTPEQAALAKQIGWAVRTMSKHTFWKSKCFAQAIAAKRMLTRRTLPGTIYLGVAKDDAGALIAHAWITSCGLTLTGGRNANRFTVVSTFGS